MSRAERYARCEFAPWPDPALLDAVQTLGGDCLIVLRLEQNRDGLTVELSDNLYYPPDDPNAALNAGSHHRLLQLEWAGRWEEGGHHSNEVFALESHDDFYGGPFAPYAMEHGPLCEVVNEPNPWIAEIVREKTSLQTFPHFGPPIMEGGVWYGRFHAPEATLEQQGRHTDYYLTGDTPPTPAEVAAALAEAQARTQAAWEREKSRPRYRHLLLATENRTLEILSEDLPRWAWV